MLCRYNGGLDTEIAYPYEAKNGTHCHFRPEAAAVFVHDVVNITEGDEKMLKNAVGVVKPVSVAFEVVSDFRFYKNGTYTSKECRKAPNTVNHAVLAVGYHHDHYWVSLPVHSNPLESLPPSNEKTQFTKKTVIN